MLAVLGHTPHWRDSLAPTVALRQKQRATRTLRSTSRIWRLRQSDSPTTAGCHRPPAELPLLRTPVHAYPDTTCRHPGTLWIPTLRRSTRDICKRQITNPCHRTGPSNDPDPQSSDRHRPSDPAAHDTRCTRYFSGSDCRCQPVLLDQLNVAQKFLCLDLKSENTSSGPALGYDWYQ